MKATATGTREWSEKSCNIQTGCRNGCWYCYAGAMARRFKRIGAQWEWTRPNPPFEAGSLSALLLTRKPSLVMFPTAHDILPENQEYAISAIVALALRGHRVLVVTKARLGCMAQLCWELKRWGCASTVEIRSTIGTGSDSIARTLEPAAPPPVERWAAIAHIHQQGIALSASCEPLLESSALEAHSHVLSLLAAGCSPVWIGPCRNWKARMTLNDAPDAAVETMAAIMAAQTPAWWDDLRVRLLDQTEEGLVRWKDGA